MLEYFKTILRKVSFDVYLFERELVKAMKVLVADEVVQLRDWCYHHFGNVHQAILNKHFNPLAVA